MMGIYKIENIINGKVYIGQSVNIKNRKTHHFSNLRNNRHTNKLLQNSWNKYGESSFKFDIIESCNEDLLDIREVYWIKEYKSNELNCGYNLESGGHRLKHHNESSKKIMGEKSRKAIRTMEWRMKIGNGHRGKKLSSETKEKIKNANTGKKLSLDTRQKIGISQRGEKHHNSKLTNETVRKVKLALYCDMKKEEILSLFKLTQKQYYNIKSLQTWGYILTGLNDYIKNRDKYYFELKKQQVYYLYRLGKSVREISIDLNYDITRVYDVLREGANFE